MDPVGEPHVLADPTELLHELEGAPPEAGDAVALLVHRLGQVGVQPQAQPASHSGGLAHEVRRNGERAAGRHGHRHPLAVVEATRDGLGRGEDGVDALDDGVGGKAAGALAQIHGSPAQVQPNTDAPCRGRDHVEDRIVAVRHDVMVVRHGRGTTERELGEADQRSS